MDKKAEVLEASPAASFNLEDKIAATHVEDTKMTKAEQIKAIDAIADNPNVTLETFAHLDVKKILLKMDLRLVPMLTLLYLLSFLDRGNIGNAKIEGLAEDLHLTGPEYNWCLVRFLRLRNKTTRTE